MNMVKVFIKGLEDKELSSFLRYYPARIKISLSGKTFEKKKKKGLIPQWIQPKLLSLSSSQ